MSEFDVTLVITNARLAHTARANDLWRIECSGGHVTSVQCLTSEESPIGLRVPTIDAEGSLILPSCVLSLTLAINPQFRDSLCHSHIHLDKCFILDRCELVTGWVPDFRE